MITPMTIGFLLFSVYPIIWVLRWSFFKYNGYSEPVFVGLGNFIRVFSRDPAYWNSLKNTFLIAGMKMIFEIPLALVLAVLLNNAGKVLTQRQLLNQVWGPNAVEHSHYLRIYMGHLRQKLEQDPARPRHFITETGIGYRFMP